MPFITAVVGSKLAIGLIALGTLTVGGTAAAAYTGSLPGGLQDDTHSLIGAPTAQPTDDAIETATPEPTDSPSATATPDPGATDVPLSSEATGPDATGLAAHGLCNAFQHGGLASASVAYASLSKAAGGADGIPAYCAALVAPGQSGKHGEAGSPTPTPGPTSDATEAPAEPKGPAAHTDHGAPATSHGSAHSGGGHGRP